MIEQKVEKEDFEKRCDLETTLKYLKRLDGEFGDVIVIKNYATKQEFMMKERVFSDKESFVEELLRTKKRATLKHPNLLPFVAYSTSTKIDKADQIYKLRTFYEYFATNVRRGMEERRVRGSDYTLEEMTYMVYDTIMAGAFLQEKDLQHGDISPDIILQTNDGHFLVGDKLKYRSKHPQNLVDKYIRGERLYISPEVYYFIRTRNSEGLDRMDNFKSDVFILGLSILEAGIMTNVTEIYRRSSNSVDKDMLKGFIDVFESRYGENPLACAILKKMLEVEEIKRPDFIDLKYALPYYQEVLTYFKDQSNKLRQIPNRAKAGNGSQKLVQGSNQNLSVNHALTKAESVSSKPNSDGRHPTLRSSNSNPKIDHHSISANSHLDPNKSKNFHIFDSEQFSDQQNLMQNKFPSNLEDNYRNQNQGHRNTELPRNTQQFGQMPGQLANDQNSHRRVTSFDQPNQEFNFYQFNGQPNNNPLANPLSFNIPQNFGSNFSNPSTPRNTQPNISNTYSGQKVSHHHPSLSQNQQQMDPNFFSFTANQQLLNNLGKNQPPNHIPQNSQDPNFAKKPNNLLTPTGLPRVPSNHNEVPFSNMMRNMDPNEDMMNRHKHSRSMHLNKNSNPDIYQGKPSNNPKVQTSLQSTHSPIDVHQMGNSGQPIHQFNPLQNPSQRNAPSQSGGSKQNLPGQQPSNMNMPQMGISRTGNSGSNSGIKPPLKTDRVQPQSNSNHQGAKLPPQNIAQQKAMSQAQANQQGQNGQGKSQGFKIFGD